MNINNAQMHEVLKLHLHKVYSTQQTPCVSSVKRSDELVLSTKARDIQQIKEALNTMPEIRTRMVQDLKSKINAGSYELDDHETADSMLSSIMNSMRA